MSGPLHDDGQPSFGDRVVVLPARAVESFTRAARSNRSRRAGRAGTSALTELLAGRAAAT